MRRLLAALLILLPVTAPAQPAALDTPEPSVLVTIEAARQGSLPHTLTAYGKVQAAPGGSETLSLLRGGQVTGVMVANGQKVRRYQKLLTVSADPAALALYRQGVTALTLASGNRARASQMLAQHLATRDQLAQADKAVADAQTTVDTLAREGGGTAEQTLLAPFDGIVSSLPVGPGARIAPQVPLITLDRVSRLIAAVGVEPAQRGLIAPGQPTRIEPLDTDGATSGSVLSVGAMLDPTSRLLPVLVDPAPIDPSQGALSVDPTPGDIHRGHQAGGRVDATLGLLPGEAVRVVIQVGEYRGWLVPRDAVLTDAKGAYLFQVKGDKAMRLDVQVSGTVADTTAVTGPVDAGRSVVTSGNYQLKGGETVREKQATSTGGVSP